MSSTDELADLTRDRRFPGTDVIDAMAEHGRLDLLKWLFVYKKMNLVDSKPYVLWPSGDETTIAAARALPTRNGSNQAAANGHLDVLRWVFQMSKSQQLAATTLLIGATSSVVVSAYPDPQGADLSAAAGRLPVLRFLERRGIHATVVGANAAAGNGHVEAVRWLDSRGVRPDQRGVDAARANGHAELASFVENINTSS